jgi:hypothetical protein
MIKDILQEIRNTITVLYPQKKLLVNSYKLEANPITTLADGYAVNLGSASSVDYSDPYSSSLDRDIYVILTKGFKDTDLSCGSRLAAEELVIDETLAIIKAVKQSPEVLKYVVDLCYESDTGIELIEADKLLAITTSILLRVRYKEIY